jgi:hypothetical protein
VSKFRSEPRQRGTAVVQACYGLFHVRDAGSTPSELRLPRGGDGLVARLTGTAVVLTGCHTGPVEVTVELFDTMPTPLVEGWDDAVELTLTTRSGEVAVVDWANRTYPALPVLHGPPGDVRLRAHARGRDAAHRRQAPEAEVVEHHLLQLWPAPGPQPYVRYTLTDEVGRRRRRQFGGVEVEAATGVTNVHRRLDDVPAGVVDGLLADLGGAEPARLDIEWLRQLQTKPVRICGRCLQAVRPNYCRDCEQFFEAGHRCAEPVHDRHLTY